MIKELGKIRDELLTGVQKRDLLYIKMQINKIDTLLYNASKNNAVLPLVTGRVYGQTVTGTVFKHKILKHSRHFKGNDYYLIKNIETGHKQIINGCELHGL